MHFRTHVKEELFGISGRDEFGDGMVEHDMHIGQFLTVLDKLGIADETLAFYSTDNGPHMNSWPDAGMTPYRGEKTPTGKVAFGCPRWCDGRAKSKQEVYPMKSCTICIGCRHF